MRAPVTVVTNAKTALGKAIVRRLAFAGHSVAAVDSCPGSVSVIAEDNRKVGTKVTGFAVDLAKDANRKELVQRVVQEFGGFDSLVVVPPKNALRGDILDTTSMQFDAIFEHTLTIPFRLVQASVAELKKAENAGIVFLSSAAAYAPQVDGGLHSVASSSVLSLMKNLSNSIAKQNIRVNGVCTGMMEGDGSGAIWDDLSKNEHAEQVRQSLQSMIPIGRIGRPSDAASAVEFLLSERAKLVALHYEHNAFLQMLRQARCFSNGLVPSRVKPAEYAERRERLGALLSKSFPNKEVVVVVKGAQRSYIAPDVPHAFRQCSNFNYLTGVRVPGAVYLLHKTAEGSQRKILFMERRTDYERLWEGDLPTDSELETTAGFDELLSPKDLPQILKKMSGPSVSLLYQDEAWTNTSIRPIRSEFSSFHAAADFIERLRWIKSDAEIEAMRDVCTMGAQMMSATIAGSRAFFSENAVVGLLEYEARRRGAEMLAYPPVVAAGNRANTIHYLDANRSIDMGDALLVDAGCDLNGYVSDITRCWPISGEWSPQQRSVYEALRDVHERLLEYANGLDKVKLSSLYRKMVALLATNMQAVGVISHQVDDKTAFSMAEDLCPHHVSHYLGMDVHDCASVSRDVELPPNVAFTIEPGVYIPKNSRFPREFQGLGFRIEDDVLTRQKGIEVLTQAVPRSAADIEYLMNPL